MAAEWYFEVGGSEFGPFPPPNWSSKLRTARSRPTRRYGRATDPGSPASKVAGLFDRAAQARACVCDKARRPPPTAGRGSASSSPPAHRPSRPPPLPSKFEVIDMAEDDGFKVEILAYPRLGGAKDHQTAATVYFANQAGIRLKQVRITLRDGEAIAESGALHFMLGPVKMESKVGGVSGLGRAMMNKFVTKEAAILPRYRGTGRSTSNRRSATS